MQDFKEKATKHLKDYVKKRGVNFHSYCILQDKDALANQFVKWSKMLTEIESRCKSVYDKAGGVKAQFKNMLRSEHISYNLFVPLKVNEDTDSIVGLFQKLLSRTDLRKITKFEIEWAPIDAKNALDDKTSFDTYVAFELENKKLLGVGIEVKYTEKSYPYTATELRRLTTEDDSSPYFALWQSDFSVYLPDTFKTLGEKSYKQYFRNHLLGLSMIKNGLVDEFVSVHLFPAGNTYQTKTAADYQKTIKSEKQSTFRPVTYEEFIAIGLETFKRTEERQWLQYLEERYIVK